MISRSGYVLQEALRRDGLTQARWAQSDRQVRRLAGSGQSGNVYYYRLLAERDVDYSKIMAATQMLDYCMRKLQIKELYLSWYALAPASIPGARALGKTPCRAFVTLGSKPTIYLLASRSNAEILFAAAHEAHHVWFERERKRGRYKDWAPNELEGLCENAASSFAEIARNELAEIRAAAVPGREQKNEDRRGVVDRRDLDTSQPSDEWPQNRPPYPRLRG
jgi:hypothetical protein